MFDINDFDNDDLDSNNFDPDDDDDPDMEIFMYIKSQSLTWIDWHGRCGRLYR